VLLLEQQFKPRQSLETRWEMSVVVWQNRNSPRRKNSNNMKMNMHIAPQRHITPDLHLAHPKKKSMAYSIDWSTNKDKGALIPPLLELTTTSHHTLQLLCTQLQNRKIRVLVHSNLPYWTRTITSTYRRLVLKRFCQSRVENAGDGNKPYRWPAEKCRKLRKQRLWRRDQETQIRCIRQRGQLVAQVRPHRRIEAPLDPRNFKTCFKKSKLLRPCRRRVEVEVESSHREKYR
jgi:hypothetical protein